MYVFMYLFMSCFMISFFTRITLFVLRLVILCLVYFFFVIGWLSVPVQSIVWKDSSTK